jgi:hypothetical protein
MTDALTDAIRRIKDLQQDVERLKSSGKQGQPRVLFVTAEQSRTSDISAGIESRRDVSSVGAYNARAYLFGGYNLLTIVRASGTDITGTADESTVKNRGISPRTYNSAFYSPPLLFNAGTVETAATTDTQTSLRDAGRVKRGVYGVSFGTSGYRTRGYGVSTIIRKTQTGVTTAVDTSTVNSRGINAKTYNSVFYSPSELVNAGIAETTAATDAQPSLRTVTFDTTAAYNTSQYQSTSYNG